MAKISGDYRRVGDHLVEVQSAGAAVWVLVMENRDERIKATGKLGLTLQKVVGTDVQVAYSSESLREVETFKKQYFSGT